MNVFGFDENKNRVNILDLVYPIGSIYISTSEINPGGGVFGGAWEAWGSGRVPLGVNASDSDFNTAEKTGGNKTHLHSTGSHTLTTNEIPEHMHKGTGGTVEKVNTQFGEGYNGPAIWGRTEDQRGKYEMYYGTMHTGGGAAHNHGNTGGASSLPPYITCYMWKRTA